VNTGDNASFEFVHNFCYFLNAERDEAAVKASA